MDIPSFANFMGFLSLALYIVSLSPSLVRSVFPRAKRNNAIKLLLKYRREIGVSAFYFAFIHAFYIFQRRRFDILNPSTLVLSYEGLTTLTIFTLLAITSNNLSVKKMTFDTWKKLHKLTYIAMFLLTWHVISKMAGHWSWVTPISIISLVIVNSLFLIRKWIESRSNDRSS